MLLIDERFKLNSDDSIINNISVSNWVIRYFNGIINLTENRRWFLKPRD